MSTSTTNATGTRPVELHIGGMTCASCAARVERGLNRIDRVTATVNYVTERATALAPATVPVTALVGPMIAGAAMAASSVFVVTNSLRLRRFAPRT